MIRAKSSKDRSEENGWWLKLYLSGKYMQIKETFWYCVSGRSVWCLRLLLRRATSNKKLFGNITICVWPWQKHQILGGKHFLIYGTRNKKNLLIEEGTIYPEKSSTANGPSCVEKTQNLSRPLESIPVSRERMVPAEWQVRTILGDCISKDRVITVQAPQYRQHALISDFPRPCQPECTRRSSIGHELDQWSTWRVKVSEPCFSHYGRPSDEQFTDKFDCTLLTNANLWAQGNNWSFTGIHRRLQQNFLRIWQSFDVMFYRTCISSYVCYFKAPSVPILTSLQSVVDPLHGCSSWKPVQDQVAWGFVLWSNSTFQHRIWSAWVDISCILEGRLGTSAPLITPENEGALHHRQILPSLMILMFLFVQGLVDLLVNQPREPQDLPDNHWIFHKDYLQLLHLLVEKEQERWINRVNGRVRDHHYQNLNYFTFQWAMVMMTSHHRLEDNGNGPDRVSDHVLHLHSLGSSPNMLYFFLESLRFTLWPVKIQMKIQKLWNHRVVKVTDRLYCRVKNIQKIKKRKETKAEVEKPNDLPKAKKHNSMDADEDDEEPQNKPGTSQPFVPVLPLNQGPALYQVCSDHCASRKWPKIPAVHEWKSQTELAIKQETCWTLYGHLWRKPQEQGPKMRSRARKEASTQEVRGYYKQFDEPNTPRVEILDWQRGFCSRWHEEGQTEELCDRTRGSPSRLTSRATSSGPRPDGYWEVSRTSRRITQQTDSPASTRPGFRMSCQMATSKGWDLFHIDLKIAFLQGQSHDVNREVVCQPATRSRSSTRYCWKIEETCI